MTNSANISIRDIPPLVPLLMGTFLAVFVLVDSHLGQPGYASRSVLTPISGRVTSVGRWSRRGNVQLRIDVEAPDRLHHLTQDYDLVYAEPLLTLLRTGDPVSALVEPDSVGRDIDWFYEIRRGDELLLQYTETKKYELLIAARYRKVDFYLSGTAALLIILSLIHRVRVGAWNTGAWNS